jgi:hypothetical protein
MITTAVAAWPNWPPTTFTAGKVFGRCENTTGVAAFTDLVSHVMTAEPYALADRMFWIVDNGSSHRGQAAIDRLQRKVLSPNDTDIDAVSDRLWRSRTATTRLRSRSSGNSTPPTSPN